MLCKNKKVNSLTFWKHHSILSPGNSTMLKIRSKSRCLLIYNFDVRQTLFHIQNCQNFEHQNSGYGTEKV